MSDAKILIIDDDLTTLRLAEMVLESAGHSVQCAESAEQAAELIAEEPPHVVLMDRVLPGIDGLELTRRLKRDARTSGIAVIAFSSHVTREADEQAIAAGSDGFIHKPFEQSALLRTVAWHVAARTARISGAVHQDDRLLAEDRSTTSEGARHTSSPAERNGDAHPHTYPFGGSSMKFARMMALGLAVTVGAVRVASAQTATQTVTFQVDPINKVAVTGTPSLTITTAVAGSAPTSVSSITNSWAVTTNQTTAKITASIPTAMPAGLTLTANLVAPAGAVSAGAVALTATATDMVTTITKLNQSGMTLTYDLSATAAAGVVASSTRIVTYTITGGT